MSGNSFHTDSDRLETALPSGELVLFAIGVNHRTADVDVREKVYIGEAEIPAALRAFTNDLSECVILSTCNRTEVFGVADLSAIDIERLKEHLVRFKSSDAEVEPKQFFSYLSCAASRHLFEVVTSLDSMVIGDSQILGQVRNAYLLAQENGTTGKILNQLFQRALMLGKRTYTESCVHSGAVSVSMAAVDLAVEKFGSLEDRSVLLIGAGESSRLAAECLIKQGVGQITIVNRTLTRAEELADGLQSAFEFECKVETFANLRSKLRVSDIVISSTSSEEPILFAEDFVDQQRPILLIDIAVPRDIDEAVGEMENVTLADIDDLKAVLERHHTRRLAGVPTVGKMIGKELGSFLMWYYSLPLMPDSTEKGVPSKSVADEMVRIKAFLTANADEFHQLARESGRDFHKDVQQHSQLIERLKARRAESEAASDIR